MENVHFCEYSDIAVAQALKGYVNLTCRLVNEGMSRGGMVAPSITIASNVNNVKRARPYHEGEMTV